MWQVRQFLVYRPWYKVYAIWLFTMFSASHPSTDNHLSKISLTELTCLQSQYICYVCIYLVVELKCFAKVLPCIMASAQEALCCTWIMPYRMTASPDCMHFRFDTCPVGFPCLYWQPIHSRWFITSIEGLLQGCSLRSQTIHRYSSCFLALYTSVKSRTRMTSSPHIVCFESKFR